MYTDDDNLKDEELDEEPVLGSSKNDTPNNEKKFSFKKPNFNPYSIKKNE